MTGTGRTKASLYHPLLCFYPISRPAHPLEKSHTNKRPCHAFQIAYDLTQNKSSKPEESLTSTFSAAQDND